MQTPSPYQVPTYSNAQLIPEMGLADSTTPSPPATTTTTIKQIRPLFLGTVKRNTHDHSPKDKNHTKYHPPGHTVTTLGTPPHPGQAGPLLPLRSQKGTTTTS